MRRTGQHWSCILLQVFSQCTAEPMFSHSLQLGSLCI